MSNLDILKQHNFNFSKKFGQNFIFDPNLLQAICNDSGITNTTQVVEIGAGSGSLTNVLAHNSYHVTAFEIDENLKPILQENLKQHNNVTLIFNDILKADLQQLELQINSPYTLVANLPYYITTPIIFKFVEEANLLTKMVIMVQKEVAERLVAKPSTKDYGVITATLGDIADIKITRIVNRKMFTPAPNVDSAVVLIEFNKNKFEISNLALYNKVVKCAFAMRRKTLANNLKNTFSFSTTQIEELLNQMQLNLAVRGETLSIEQFVQLTNLINKIIK